MTNTKTFEPTAEMCDRWPGISEKTEVVIVNMHKIDVPAFKNVIEESPPEHVTEYEPVPTLSSERLNLIQVGGHWCYYWIDKDTLFVQLDVEKKTNKKLNALIKELLKKIICDFFDWHWPDKKRSWELHGIRYPCCLCSITLTEKPGPESIKK